uniref:DUF3644 domain-containing protein n=1 Tax=Parastrongyloides trichosuri TaxID=131310 RepID=A0A0N4Z088_PARTI
MNGLDLKSFREECEIALIKKFSYIVLNKHLTHVAYFHYGLYRSGKGSVLSEIEYVLKNRKNDISNIKFNWSNQIEVTYKGENIAKEALELTLSDAIRQKCQIKGFDKLEKNLV